LPWRPWEGWGRLHGIHGVLAVWQQRSGSICSNRQLEHFPLLRRPALFQDVPYPPGRCQCPASTVQPVAAHDVHSPYSAAIACPDGTHRQHGHGMCSAIRRYGVCVFYIGWYHHSNQNRKQLVFSTISIFHSLTTDASPTGERVRQCEDWPACQASVTRGPCRLHEVA
jgi:hypothetical protein